MHELGGHPVVLRAEELQLSRGEALRDTALVLSRHVAAVGVRTGPDAMLAELARYSDVPVVNMLTALHHPCQALADLLTLREAYGTLEGLRVAYVGDGNNVARSLAVLGTLAGMHVAVASPAGLHAGRADPAAGAGARGHARRCTAIRARRCGTRSAVYTDVWVSMGDEATARGDDGRRRRARALAPYALDDALLDAAAPGAFAMHDLPAHPGEEISAEVLYGSRQRIWDQAENRRHAQKALLELLLAPAPGPPRHDARARDPVRRGTEPPASRGAPVSADGPILTSRRRAPARRAGEELELQIDSLAFGGEGVARLGDERLCRVRRRRHSRGSRARGRCYKRKRTYAHARTIEVLEPSPERIAPTADHPGVPWQVLPYERQLEVKRGAGGRGAAPDRASGRVRAARRSCRRCSSGGIATSSSTRSGRARTGELVCGFHASGGRAARSPDRAIACSPPSWATARASWRSAGVASRG